jgi:hypothetical protein
MDSITTIKYRVNDEKVYKYFKLSKDNIKLIKETKINGYND